MDGPYRTPAEVEREKPSLLERLSKNKGATATTGFLTIVGVVVAVVAVFELPGLAMLYVLGLLNGKGMPAGNEKYGMAMVMTGGAGIFGYFFWRFLKGFWMMMVEVGEIVLKKLRER